MDRLKGIVAQLRAPDGCPWDREQTHQSLRQSLLEECYEVLEAINTANDDSLCEELGDLLLQVLMHAQIASEEARFDLDQVIHEISEKLIRRHPHVFGEERLADSEAVLKQWEEIKREEKGADASVLHDIPSALPALMRAQKAQKKAARVGFDWQHAPEILDKIQEELEELKAALATGIHAAIEEELGDLLFSVVNLARKENLDAELTLHQATGKFIKRFQQMENLVQQEGRELKGMTLAEMDEKWRQVKQLDGSGPAPSSR